MKCFAKSARFEHVHPRKNWCFSPEAKERARLPLQPLQERWDIEMISSDIMMR